MAVKDTSKPGPAAYFVFAAHWMALGIRTIATPSPLLNHWLQLAAHLALAEAFLSSHYGDAARNERSTSSNEVWLTFLLNAPPCSGAVTRSCFRGGSYDVVDWG